MSSGPRRRHGTVRALFWVELGLALAAAVVAVGFAIVARLEIGRAATSEAAA
jgi:hypothetical protein